MTRNQTESNSRYYRQQELAALDRAAEPYLVKILDYFQIECQKKNNRYAGPCPVHGGDSPNACAVYHSGDRIGNWACYTHQCEKVFQPSITGYVRGIISFRKYGWRGEGDKMCPLNEAVDFLKKIIQVDDVGSLQFDDAKIEQSKFVHNTQKVYARKADRFVLDLEPDLVRSSLEIPCRYCISRGYQEKTMKKYDIGLCLTPKKPMYMRSVVPIYDDDHTKVVGCTGRSIFDSFYFCDVHHNPTHQCPPEQYRMVYSKWKHNKGFPADEFLYNYWFAKDYIRKSSLAVLVESPGNVWRLEEAGIHNSVGMFGAALKPGQRSILDKSGALALLVLTDPDKAGKVALEEIRKSCGNTYAIYESNMKGVDIGEATPSVLREKLVPYIIHIEEALGLWQTS